MTNSQLTVREALSQPDPKAEPGRPNRWTAFETRVQDEVKGIKWTTTMPDVAALIGELFDIPVPGLLLGSWRKADALLRLLRESEQSPDEVMYLELAEHTIDRELNPYIEIRIENLPAKRLEFTVRLSFRLKGFVLKVQKGQIKEILPARCELGGTIEFMKKPLLIKEFAPINLPGSIPLTGDDAQVNQTRRSPDGPPAHRH